jgi:putative membrane protein
MRIAGSILVAITLLLGAFAAQADAPAVSSEQLLAKALQASMVEVELGKLAQQNAESTGVNALGVRLQRDHARIGKVLAAVSRDKGMVVPTSLESGQQAQIAALSTKRGAEFDAAYVDQMVANHDAAVVLYTALSECDDLVLSRLAKRALPILREDQRLAGTYEKLSPTAGVQPAVASK